MAVVDVVRREAAELGQEPDGGVARRAVHFRRELVAVEEGPLELAVPVEVEVEVDVAPRGVDGPHHLLEVPHRGVQVPVRAQELPVEVHPGEGAAAVAVDLVP